MRIKHNLVSVLVVLFTVVLTLLAKQPKPKQEPPHLDSTKPVGQVVYFTLPPPKAKTVYLDGKTYYVGPNWVMSEDAVSTPTRALLLADGKLYDMPAMLALTYDAAPPGTLFNYVLEDGVATDISGQQKQVTYIQLTFSTFRPVEGFLDHGRYVLRLKLPTPSSICFGLKRG